jgi:hypothetical protein
MCLEHLDNSMIGPELCGGTKTEKGKSGGMADGLSG